MGKNYLYQCNSCNKEFSADKIESEMIYLCPHCGKSEKNKPLEGVLSLKYDYNELKHKYNKIFFESISAGDIWKYPDLWPIDFSRIEQSILDNLSLPQNQFLTYQTTEHKLIFQDETRNPTYSFKDRATIAVLLKAKELGINEVAAASTGNAGSSLAGISSKLGMKSHIFVPKNIPEAKRIQIQAYGANIYLVDGDYDAAFDLSLEISEKNNWYNRNTAFNPLTIEGKKSAAFDIYINSNGEMPDVIYVPVGDGVIISGIYKGFSELLELGLIDKLPQLIAVQAEGSKAVVEFILNKKFVYKSAETIADSISAGAPRNLFMAAESVFSSKGFGISVSDQEIISAQKLLAQQYGILAEPSCAASYAGYLNTKEQFDSSTKIMLLITGSGLKDFNSLKLWNKEVSPKTSEEWKKLLIKK